MYEVDIAFKLHDGINFYWHFYVPSAVALLGWIFSRKEPWQWSKRIAISIAFIGFVVFNIVALVKSYVALEAVVAGLQGSESVAGLSQGVLSAITARLDMGPWEAGIAFHFVVDFIVLYFILFWSGRKIAT